MEDEVNTRRANIKRNVSKQRSKKEGEELEYDSEYWIGGDDDRLMDAEQKRKKLKKSYIIPDIYPNRMDEEHIDGLKEGFWCTEPFIDFKPGKKNLPISNVFGLKSDVLVEEIKYPMGFEIMAES